MSEYTPTTDEIRTRGLEGADLNDLNSDERETLDEFDQWLAKHDAEVERAAAEKALDAFADTLGVRSDEDDSDYERGYRDAQRAGLSRLTAFTDTHYRREEA